MSYVYRIHRLPITDDPSLNVYLAGKISSLRLAALQNSSQAFSSTFERESAWTASSWVKLLQRPSHQILIAVAYPSKTPLASQTIQNGDWIGCGTVIGPTTKEIYDLPDNGGPEVGSDEKEEKYHMTFVYNSPLHRGKGVMKMLIQAAIEFAEENAKRAGKRWRIRCFIKPTNLVVRALYASCGFEDAGSCTFVEAYKANGDEDLLPSDGGMSEPEKYHTRIGLVMAKTGSCS